MQDGQLGWGVSFLIDSLPKVGVFSSQQWVENGHHQLRREASSCWPRPRASDPDWVCAVEATRPVAPSSRAGAACGCALILDAGAGCGRWHSRCPETDLQVQGPMAARAPVGPPLQGQSVCLQEPHTLVNEGTGWVGLPGAHGPPWRSGLEHAVWKQRAPRRPRCLGDLAGCPVLPAPCGLSGGPHLTEPHQGSLFCLVSGLVLSVDVNTWLMILNLFL